MALYIPHSIFHLARLLCVRPETLGPYYVCVCIYIYTRTHLFLRLLRVLEMHYCFGDELPQRNQNYNHEDIKTCSNSGNTCWYSVQKDFNSTSQYENLKIHLKIIISSVVIRGYERWTTSKTVFQTRVENFKCL